MGADGKVSKTAAFSPQERGEKRGWEIIRAWSENAATGDYFARFPPLSMPFFTRWDWKCGQSNTTARKLCLQGWTQPLQILLYGETLSFHRIVCCINRTPPAQDPPDSIITETGAEVQQLQEAKTALLDKGAKGVCSTLFLTNCLRCIALLQKKLVIQPKRP